MARRVFVVNGMGQYNKCVIWHFNFDFFKGQKIIVKALLPAFITALMVAAYAIIHGIGVRVSGDSLSYITWLFITVIWLTLFVLVPRFSLLRNNEPRPFLVEFCPAYDML